MIGEESCAECVMRNSTTFLAAFPSIQSAIKVHGDGNGMRIQFDIPESEMANAAELGRE